MRRTVLIVAFAAFCVAGSAVAQDRSQVMGSGARSEDSGQIFGSGGFLGSGNRTADDGGGTNGSGTLTTNASGVIGSGTRSEDSGYLIGGGRGGYYGSGLSGRQLRLSDGSSLLVVSWDDGMFVIPIEE